MYSYIRVNSADGIVSFSSKRVFFSSTQYVPVITATSVTDNFYLTSKIRSYHQDTFF